MSRRFGRNQRRKMREKIYGLELRLYEIRLWMEENSLREKSIPKAHRSHRTYFGGEQCMNCGCTLGSIASREPCTHKDKMLEALEGVIGMAFSLEEVRSEHIHGVVSEFIAGDIENLIAHVKGGAE